MSPRILKPQPGPQELFLSSPADIAVYGGAAFGGKTWAILVEASRHTGNPEFGGVIFRRSSPQITNEGGLWDEAGKIFPELGASLAASLEAIFPSGARIAFRHLIHETTKYDWQGSQVPFLGFDELTHFSESQFFYMLSRNRSTCGIRPYVRATCNPDASSWVKRFLAPWVDRKYADPAKSGEIRWFVRIKGELVWSRSKADLATRFPGIHPKSVTFVRATIYDNKIGLDANPEYLANLMALGVVEQARLLRGNWDALNDGLVYPKFGTIVVEPEHWPKTLVGGRHGGIDWGWNNPFAALGGVLIDDVLWVWHERYGSQITLTEHSKALPRDGTRWWGDPAGADQIAELRRAGHDVVPSTHLGSQPLDNGIAMVHDRIDTGRLKVLGTCGNVIDEAGKYHFDAKGRPVDADNHALAALRYMVTGIDRGKAVKDKATEETPEARIARLEDAYRREMDAIDRRHEESLNPENPHWWGDDDD